MRAMSRHRPRSAFRVAAEGVGSPRSWGSGRRVLRYAGPLLLTVLVTACSAAPDASRSSLSELTTSPPATAARAPGDGTTVGSAQPESTGGADCAGVAAALQTRARALQTGDARLWSSSFSSADPSAARRDAAVFPVLRKLRISLSIGPIRPRANPAEVTGATVCVADLGYAIAGFDRTPRVVVTTVTTQPRPAGGGAVITALAADPQPWDLPDVDVWRDPQATGVVVIGNVPQTELRRADREARDARTAVAAVWGPSPGLVIVLPRSSPELAAQLRRSEASLTATAAVTDGPLTAGERASSDRIYLNLTAMAGLGDRGRQTVVTHEVTHVAVRATTTEPVPMWLSEGFAQWVGYHHVGASAAETAPTLLAAVRAGHPPSAWPTDAEFDQQTASGRADMLSAYERSWSVVAYLITRSGTQPLIDFYRACATRQTDCEATMPTFFGAARAELVTGWRGWLTTWGRHA